MEEVKRGRRDMKDMNMVFYCVTMTNTQVSTIRYEDRDWRVQGINGSSMKSNKTLGEEQNKLGLGYDFMLFISMY
jgi:hypothetical protein